MECSNCSESNIGTESPGCGKKGNCLTGGCGKLSIFNWLNEMEYNIDSDGNQFPFAEVQFKNTRKVFCSIPKKIRIYDQEFVKVETSFGFDIGIVTLTGKLTKIQMEKNQIHNHSKEILKIIDRPTKQEIINWEKNRNKEMDVLITTRRIAKKFNMNMKISDVEVQADGKKITFYYIADKRIDFREFIKILAQEFKQKIEMKQIGARQESGITGAIGSCGRELCCSTWLKDFKTVNINAARYQQLSINSSKISGQCGKLKCCLNFELDNYMEALKKFPPSTFVIKTKKGNAHHQKTDIFNEKIWYSYDFESTKLFEFSIDKIKEIIKINEKEDKIEDLETYSTKNNELKTDLSIIDFEQGVGQDSINRFDSKNKFRKKKKVKK